MNELEARVRRLEDRERIEELAVRYGFCVDDRDFDGIRALFSPTATLRTKAGVIKGSNQDEVVAYFTKHLPNLTPSNHFVHGHVIEFDDSDPDTATGIVSSHAEMVRNGIPMITAMRYYDTYRRVDGQFVFEERVQTYMYFVDVREYVEALGSDLPIRSGAQPQAGDWPPKFE
jgi:SnoaL-like protein